MNKIVTSDIYFAAALITEGAKLGTEPDRSDARHIKFEFIHDAIDLDIYHIKWMNGEVVGNLCEYSEAIRKMKQVLHSG